MKNRMAHGMKQTHGFTFIELAIVLLIVGLVFAAVLGPLGTRIEAEERQKTQAMLEDIKEALYGFAMANGRLPCPDTDDPPDGLENWTGTPRECNDEADILPWVDLGVPGTDSWGRYFQYRVTGSFANDPPGAIYGTCPAPSQASFNLCDPGDVDVCDRSPRGADCTGATSVASNVPAIVVSHGKQRFIPNDPEDPPSADEEDNFEDGDADDNTGRFVYRQYSGNPGEEFDDLVVWISPNILKNRMVMAERLP
jgi:prepilin-type N-terminal cleavage/methylation domain-containing protein